MTVHTFTVRRYFHRSWWMREDPASLASASGIVTDELIDSFDVMLTECGATRIPGPLHFHIEMDDSPLGLPAFALSGPAVMVY